MIYNIRDLSQGEEAGGCSLEVRLDGNPYPQTRSPFPRGFELSGSVFLAPTWSSPTSTQVVALSEPNFWTYSLQIHCNGSAGPRSHPPLGPVRKPWPYNWRRLWEELLVRWCVQRIVKAGSSPLGRLWWPVYCTIRREPPGGS